MILIGSLVVTWVILPILVIGFPPMIIVGKSDVFAALNIYMLGLPLQVVLAFSVPILLIVMMVMMFITNRFGLKEGSNVAM